MISNDFLEHSEYIDWREPSVLAKACELNFGVKSKGEIAKRCFEFVRDEIQHSSDFPCSEVTIRASEVLAHFTGFCYAKSHLLAALLRANSIPAALCYQRLSVGDGTFCLHGLNAVWLDFSLLHDSRESNAQSGENTQGAWYRVDPRGNRAATEHSAEIFSDFSPPLERLAFSVTQEGEIDSHRRHARPLGVVTRRFRRARSVADLDDELPDLKAGV